MRVYFSNNIRMRVTFMRYRGQKILIKYGEYNFNYFSTKKYGVILLFISNKVSEKEKSRALHKVLKTWR